MQDDLSTQRSNRVPPDTTGKCDGHIYTRFGDAGDTTLLGRITVHKDHPRVNVYGTFDEATSALGLARASTRNDDICRDIMEIQGELIDVMTELASPPRVAAPLLPIDAGKVERLEHRIDAYENERIVSGIFVRPGGSLAGAALDLARTVVRRAERLVVTLSATEDINPVLMQYINRLSDLLYVMARVDEEREIRRVVMSALEANEPKIRLDLPTSQVLNLETSNTMIAAGIRRAKAIGVPMVLSVVNVSGDLIALQRMDGALEVSVTLAPHKAYTAASLRMPTAELALLAQPGAPLYGIDTNMPQLTLVGGGLPLVAGGATLGAVGVSGGSVEQDVDVARAMLAAVA
jgi:ATP:cob(I)alamin adenosyltransferase